MNRTFLALLLAFVAAANGSKLAERADKLFEEFKEKFHKKYETVEEEIKRKAIFLESMKRCDAKNERNGSPAFGVTKFSDLTEEEFGVFLGRKGKGVVVDESKVKVRAPSGKARVADAASGAVDWVSLGKVTPVKNQGQCGSCWAFSAAEQVESAWTMAGHARWEFSPQQIASCTPDMYGCGGGDTVAAYEYLMGNSTAGLANAWFAPYVQSMYDLCESKKCTESCDDLHLDQMVKNAGLAGPFASVTGYEYATPPCYGKCKNQDTTLLANNVAEYGPASICVNAASWGDYTGGVLKYDTCGEPKYSSIDHCVQLVGFNATASSPYWIVKNSWSIDWGENGYILLEYPLNTCALADEATFVTLKST